ncbi:MAG: hypothetical protein Aurels2KO_46120 [Aureliella sp.]
MGDPRESIRLASNILIERLCTSTNLGRVSSFYHTPPVGGPSGQPPFVNAVVWVNTDLNPWETWSVVRDVENELGRVRLQRWEARRIDVDILLFGDQRIWTPQLKIPHPRMCMRRFILVPAAEVAPDFVDPVTGASVQQLAATLGTHATHVTVLASSDRSAIAIVEEAARLTGARLEQGEAELATSADGRRTLQCIQGTDLSDVTVFPPGNLVIYLTPPIAVEGALWEDYHRQAAERLNLCAPSNRDSDGLQSAVISGKVARYLLASDTPSWATHEIVAALQAIDCPVEKLT